MNGLAQLINDSLESGKCVLKNYLIYLKVGGGTFAAFAAWSAFGKWRDESAAKRIEWLYDSYKQIAETQDFKDVRMAIEYNFKDFAGIVEKLCEKNNDSIQAALDTLSAEEKSFFMKLDNFLHFINLLAYLRRNDHLPRTDIVIDFEYWFSMFLRPEYAVLQRYIRTWRYTEIIAEMDRRMKPPGRWDRFRSTALGRLIPDGAGRDAQTRPGK